MGCFISRQKGPISIPGPRDLTTSKAISSPNTIPPGTSLPDLTEEIKVRPGQFIQFHSGSYLQDYNSVKVVGEGAFGKVYLAEHKGTLVQRAVKELDKSKAEKNQQSRFIEEVEILARLDHPNILKLFELYEDEKQYFVVSELLTGGELFDYLIKIGHLSETSAARIMYQILSAVTYCHQNNIVHRDLKPENLLLETPPSDTDEIIIKVIDFGTSSLFTPSTSLHKRIGTPYYIAPEVLGMNYTEKCDVWSCGVILYILLSGYPPFPGKNNEEILRKVKTGQFNFHHSVFRSVSTEAKTLIRRMLVMDPTARCTAESALQDPWITKHAALNRPINKAVALESLENLRKFRADEKLKQAAVTFITTQLLTKEQTVQLRDVFRSLDRNGDGRLSKEELIYAYRAHNSVQKSQEIVEHVMKTVDVDKNGFIDYSEFIAASMNFQTLICRANLEQAFRAFDKDGSGSISVSELKELLGFGQDIHDTAWDKIISEVDQNSDGEIDLKEFINMMLQTVT